MRTGMGISIGLHAAIFAAAVVGLPGSSLNEPEPIDAMPVEIVPIDEVTDLKLGNKEVEPEKTAETPKALPDRKAETEQPDLTEKAAKTPIKEAREPAPLPTPKKPEVAKPEKKAETDVAALTPEPALEPKPEKPAEALAPAPKPKQRPKPPKTIVEPKLQAKKPEKERTFSSDHIATLLNKQKAAGGGAPEPTPDPQTFGSIEGSVQAEMTQSDIAALGGRLQSCYRAPQAVVEANLVVQLSFHLNSDTTIASPPKLIDGNSHPLSQIAFEAATRAVYSCRLDDILPPERYEAWKHLTPKFYPKRG